MIADAVSHSIIGPMERALTRYVLFALCLTACGRTSTESAPTPPSERALPAASTFAIDGASIMQNGRRVTFAGVNALHVYGGNSDAMPAWRVGIVREFIRNLNDQPITGEAIFSATSNAYFHSLRTVVERNRRNGLITVLCPFGWDTRDVLGLNPSEQPFYPAFKARMRAIAAEFRDEPDVWLEVWNEPYDWQGGRGYSDDLWLRDMQDMVDNIRSSGNRNIVLVPGAEAGQSEAVLLTHGAQLLHGRSNMLFDIHAYEKWLLGTTPARVAARIRAVQAAGLALIFGEISPFNAGAQMDVRLVLDAAVNARVGAMAWLWKDDASDRSALRGRSGEPNDTDNGAWGTTFRTFLTQIATLPPG